MWVPLTPLDFYRRSRHLFADKCGVVDQGIRLTFGDFGDRVERLAGALRDEGRYAVYLESVLPSPEEERVLRDLFKDNDWIVPVEDRSQAARENGQ